MCIKSYSTKQNSPEMFPPVKSQFKNNKNYLMKRTEGVGTHKTLMNKQCGNKCY